MIQKKIFQVEYVGFAWIIIQYNLFYFFVKWTT